MYVWFDTRMNLVLHTGKEMAVFEDRESAIESIDRFIEGHYGEEVVPERLREVELKVLVPDEAHLTADDACSESVTVD